MPWHAAPRRAGRGYSLIELLAVLAILGILASMAAPLAQMTVERERESELRRALWQIRDALDAYQAARASREIDGAASPGGESGYPPTLDALVQAYPDQRPDHRGEVRRFLRSVPRDPFADPSLPADKTWALRSYTSDVDSPQPGADVYDVHSRAAGTGLNGIPLSQW